MPEATGTFPPLAVGRGFLRYEEARQQLLQQVIALPEAQLQATPRRGGWSTLEVLEHVALAERSVFQNLPDPATMARHEQAVEHRIRWVIVVLAVTFRIPLRVPSPEMAPGGSRTLAEVRQLWEENTRWLRHYAQHAGRLDRDEAVFRHPVAGPMTFAQVTWLGRKHVDVHARQVRRIQRDT